ncbi:type II toxin-antitoxin system prevent-host-death family antitoxin [Arcicella sp. LKC2W]|uniref:type II toxin-antitoxin system prevent-host-death family antitoxin n=1 Tax=Arcicella sp. LKC2W TaxID=2984198 RepID=UPI002B1F136B|nr:type II toxin-antitoxin system prevent-host-death family antitoxin [Arcicella sp. LKC2W]MEA5457500.1 type II toxin-antitoxin system prevent-host-death family antitoxin [Arcicella sp. LKC2W]
MQYIVNDKGKNTAVIVPIKEWDELQRIKKKLQIFDNLDNALQEVKDVKAGKRTEGRSLEDFLNEN